MPEQQDERLYNPERKKRFLKIQRELMSESSIKTIEANLRTVSKEEKRLEKDICDFSFKEIIDIYKRSNAKSINGLLTKHSIFASYCNWALAQDLVKDGQNHFNEIDKKMIQALCVNKNAFNMGIVTRDQVSSWANKLTTARDKYVLLALFEIGKGKRFSTITEPKPSDLKDDGLMVNGKVLKISDQLRNAILEAIKEKSFLPKNSSRTNPIPLMDVGTIFKYYPNTSNFAPERKARAVYSRVTRIFAELDVKGLSADSIVSSGMVHMINTRVKELDVSLDEYFSNFFYEVTYQYGYKDKRKYSFKDTYKDFLHDNK